MGGWIANRALAVSAAGAPGAAVLDNFFPVPTGALLRRGSVKRFTAGQAGRVKSLFRYVSGNLTKLFASTTGPIIDVTGSTPTIVRTEGTNADWHVQQFTTSGGTFLIGVNGQNAGWVYDGTTFAATTITFPAGAGLNTSDLSYVWSYANRLFFLQKNTADAWYLPVDAVGGELTRLPLGGMLQRGGALLWGQSWSLASGGDGGLSDQCVFVSTEGEVLAYQGQNPSDANGWSKVGLYRIGKPLGAKAFVRAGGDLLIATTVGLVSLAAASQKDLAALGEAAVSYPISEAWDAAVRLRGLVDWRCAIWAEGRMLVVAPPVGVGQEPVCFVANVNTGAWCRFTGWSISAMETFGGALHFGDYDRGFWAANVTGSDAGMPYTGTCIPLFTDLGSPASRKVARNARLVMRSGQEAKAKLTAMFDFDEHIPVGPAGSVVEVGDVWGAAEWGVSKWGSSGERLIDTGWQSVGGSGQDVSICVQVTSGSLPPIDVELIRVDSTFETAGIIS